MSGESGGTSRLNVDEVNSQCDLVAEREAKRSTVSVANDLQRTQVSDLKAKRSKSTFLNKTHLIGLKEVLQVFYLAGELMTTVRIANHDTMMGEILQLYTRMDI